MIDILAGALSGAGCCRAETVPARDGVLLMAIDVAQFVDPEAYFEQVAELVAHVKSCPPAPGFEEIFVPGEIEFREAKRRRLNGIAICSQVWNDLQAIMNQLNVRRPIDIGSNGAPSKRHTFSGDAVPSDLAAS
jgi:hydroxycarboxylate dehydrogenase B